MRHLVWLSLFVAGWGLWSCQLKITVAPGEYEVLAGEVGSSREGAAVDAGVQEPGRRPDAATPTEASPERPSVPKARRLLLLEKSGDAVGQMKLLVVTAADGKTLDITPKELFQKSYAIYVSYRSHRFRSAKWPNRAVVQFSWEGPGDQILLASVPSEGASTQISVLDLKGQRIYSASLPKDLKQLHLSPDGTDIWYEKGDRSVGRWRRHGAVAPLAHSLVSKVLYDATGKQIAYNWRKTQNGPLHTTLMGFNGDQANDLPLYRDPATGQQIERCSALRLFAQGLLCQQGANPWRAVLWFVTRDGKWHQVASNHAGVKERTEQWIGMLSPQLLAVWQRQKDGPYRLFAFDLERRKSEELWMRKSEGSFAAYGQAIASGVFIMEESYGPMGKRSLSYLPLRGKLTPLTSDFGTIEPGYQLIPGLASAPGQWVMLLSQWTLGRLPSTPSPLMIYHKGGKRLFRHNASWSSYLHQRSADGDFVAFLEIPGPPGRQKPFELRWVTLSTGVQGALKTPLYPGLLALVP